MAVPSTAELADIVRAMAEAFDNVANDVQRNRNPIVWTVEMQAYVCELRVLARDAESLQGATLRLSQVLTRAQRSKPEV